ncbi:hypothetical protein SUDANB95_07936 (plasmid) [Actinosynnema sp. ALI-1.44]
MARSKRPAMLKLARAVTEVLDVVVDAGFDTEGRSTKWYLTWGNGPTVDQVRRVVRAMARDFPDIEADQVGLRRNPGDRHVVAAWLHRAAHDDRVGPFAAETRFGETSFEVDDRRRPAQPAPGLRRRSRQGYTADILNDDPVWELVDYAFDACGSSTAYSDQVVRHVESIGGPQGLRIEHWLDRLDRLDPAVDDPPVPPALDVSAISDRTRRELASVVDTMVHELCGRSPRRHDARVRMLAAEVARSVLQQAAHDGGQRSAALLAVAGGTSLSWLSRLLGKSPWTLGKRWPAERFGADLASLVWLRTNREMWARACAAAVAAIRSGPSWLVEDRELAAPLLALDRAVRDAGENWTRLTGTPDTARELLREVAAAQDRHARDRRIMANLGFEDRTVVPADVPRSELAALEDLLKRYDSAPPPQRRGGARAALARRRTAVD